MVSRGTIFILISQLIFLFSGFAINIILARSLGPSEYGIFGLVLSILIIAELFVITGIPEALKKFGGEKPEFLNVIIKKTFIWQLGYSFIVFAIFLIITPLIAQWLNDERLSYLLRIAAIDIVFYGLYKYFAAIQNGLHNFFKYAFLGIIYSTAKIIAIVGLIVGGFALIGALVGNILGSAIALGFAIVLAKLPNTHFVDQTINTRKIIHFIFPNILYFLGLNLLFSVDLWLVKYFLNDLQVGYYVSARVLARLPYFLSIGLSAVILPSLSHAIANGNNKRAKDITLDSLRYLLIFLFLLCVIVIVKNKAIIGLFFGKNYSDASSILVVLIVAFSFVTIMAINHTILISYNKMTSCFLQIFFLITFEVFLLLIFIPKYQLLGACLATLFTGLLGTTISLFYIKEKSTILISFVKLSGITILVYYLSKIIDHISSNLFLDITFLTFIYLLLVVVVKEIRYVDFRRFKEVLASSSKI